MAANEKYLTDEGQMGAGMIRIQLSSDPMWNGVIPWATFVSDYSPQIVYANGTTRNLTTSNADKEYFWRILPLVESICALSTAPLLNCTRRWNQEDGAGMVDAHYFGEAESSFNSGISFWGDEDAYTQDYRSVRCDKVEYYNGK